MYLHGFEAKVIVLEVFVIDDGRVEFFGVSHDDLISRLGNHRTWFVVFGVDIGIEILNDLRELFLGLLVQIRHGDTKVSMYCYETYRAARIA
jgi:hypothetical protein